MACVLLLVQKEPRENSDFTHVNCSITVRPEDVKTEEIYIIRCVHMTAYA